MEGKEKELWDSLYTQRVKELRESFGKIDDPVQRGLVLRSLESLTENVERGWFGFSMGSRRGTARDYMDEIGDSEMAEKVGKVLENPDAQQISDIFMHGDVVRIAEDLSCSADNVRQIKRRLLGGKSKSSYYAAGIAHWLIQKGYKVE